jgi:hypothetical protein
LGVEGSRVQGILEQSRGLVVVVIIITISNTLREYLKVISIVYNRVEVDHVILDLFGLSSLFIVLRFWDSVLLRVECDACRSFCTSP